MFYTTDTNQIRLTIDDNVSSPGYIFAGGTVTGLRINGNDYGNTIYQHATSINGQAANIGFTLTIHLILMHFQLLAFIQVI